jgi:hypothetical protein
LLQHRQSALLERRPEPARGRRAAPRLFRFRRSSVRNPTSVRGRQCYCLRRMQKESEPCHSSGGAMT